MTSYSGFFLAATSKVTLHLLGINTESTEFQPNFTGFKLAAGANIRCPCDMLEVVGEDHKVLLLLV